MNNNNLIEEEKWLDKLKKHAEKCKKIISATCCISDNENAEIIQNCITNYDKTGLYFVFSKQKNKFVIGYKPKYFHDASFAPLIMPISGEKLTNIDDLLLKIKLANFFDFGNKSSLSIEELKIFDKLINNSEFLQYLNDVNEKKKSNKNCKLLKISSIINNNEKEF